MMSVEEKSKYREYIVYKENKSLNHKNYGALGLTFNKALLLPNAMKHPFGKKS